MFNSAEHCSARIQRAVGLRSPVCEIPRLGDRTTTGERDECQVPSYAHMETMSTQEAAAVFAVVPDNDKNAPGSYHLAMGISKLASNAADNTPAGCGRRIRQGGGEPAPCRFYCAIGGKLYTTFAEANKAIAFIYVNMDQGFRVQWNDLTGHEQWEWLECYERNGKTHTRVADSVGLRGTDIGRLHTAQEVENAMLRSPSLNRRRPNNHAVTQAEWDAANEAVNRVLFG